MSAVLGAQAWLPARGLVQAAIARRLEVDSSGEIFRLDTYCPWKGHLYELEQELKLPTTLKFCIYQARLHRGEPSVLYRGAEAVWDQAGSVAQARTCTSREKQSPKARRHSLTVCTAQDERERKWRVQAVSVSPASFQNRRSLPAAWRGLRDAELSAVAGIPGLVFVHASGFIGGANTQEAAVEMARRALVTE